MKILITGAGGMLGTDLTFALYPHFPVFGVGRSAAAHLSIPYSLCDLSKREQATRAIAREKPNMIFHAAAMTDVDGCELHRHDALLHNLEATKHVAEAAVESNAFLVFFSTDYVYDGSKLGEYVETDPPKPLNVYGESKLLAEKYIQAHVPNYQIFRTSWLYGTHGKSFPRAILGRAKTQSELNVVIDQKGRPTYTKDIARAFERILISDAAGFMSVPSGIYHLAGSEATTWNEFAKTILKQSHFDSVQVHETTTAVLNRPALRPKNSVLSIEKAKQDFGMCLRSWQEALPEFLEELKTTEIR